MDNQSQAYIYNQNLAPRDPKFYITSAKSESDLLMTQKGDDIFAMTRFGNMRLQYVTKNKGNLQQLSQFLSTVDH